MSAQVPVNAPGGASPSLSFVFWNLRRNFPRDHLAALVTDHRPDILMLTESAPSTHSELSSLTGPEYRAHSDPNSRFLWIVRRSRCRFRELQNRERFSLARVQVSGTQPLLLALVHFPDSRNYGRYDRASCARELARIIEGREDADGHCRTLVVGDFNMDPFDEGMVAGDAFHAVMSRDIVREEGRVVQGKRYRMFFNPMWRLIANGITPGSYYFRHGELVEYFWHVFDQVLVRPALLPHFPDERTEFLTATSFGPLLANGRPDKQISDHLPLKFQLSPPAVP